MYISGSIAGKKKIICYSNDVKLIEQRINNGEMRSSIGSGITDYVAAKKENE